MYEYNIYIDLWQTQTTPNPKTPTKSYPTKKKDATLLSESATFGVLLSAFLAYFPL
jgi:hypothetical protein